MFDRVTDRPFTAGEFVSTSFGVWWRNLGRFSLLSFLMYLPLVVGGAASVFWVRARALEGGPLPDPGALWSELLPILIPLIAATLVLWAVQMSALTYGAIQDLAGRKARLGEMLGVGFRRALPATAVLILSFLAIGTGWILLVVPGIVVTCIVCVAVPVAVVERVGVFGALRRSAALTSGRRGALFASFFVFGIAILFIALVNEYALPLLWQPLGTAGVFIAPIVSLAVSVATASLPTLAPAVAYHDLRVEKEGVDTSDLAKVFE